MEMILKNLLKYVVIESLDSLSLSVSLLYLVIGLDISRINSSVIKFAWDIYASMLLLQSHKLSFYSSVKANIRS